MIKRDITQLAVYQIEDEVETLPLAYLRRLYLEKTSEIIYITKEKKLYGIICMKEALHRNQNEEIQINKAFMRLTGYNVMKAHEIFRRKRNVHKIPVVNEGGELLGDYSRWDDMLYIERNHAQLMQQGAVRKILEPYEAVYMVAPIENSNTEYLCLVKYLKQFQINYTVIKKEQVGEKLLEKAICIFLNEDERRGVQCLYGIKPLIYDSRGYDVLVYDKLVDTRWQLRMATYRSLLFQIMEEESLERVKAKKSACRPNRRNVKVSVLLSELERRGIKCFCLYSEGNDISEYWKIFNAELVKSLQSNPISLKSPWSKAGNKDFYDDLYQLNDYQKEIAQREIFEANCSFEYRKNIVGKYFNAKDGRRITCFQPDEYIGTIYLLGMCTIVGRHVEDQYTIASYLQLKLLEKGYAYRVENYGAELRLDAEIDSSLEKIGRYCTNDIVICQSNQGEADNIQGISLEKIYEKNCVPVKWIMDVYGHCNHKVNQLIADNILDEIEPRLAKEKIKNNSEEIQINICDVMRDYVKCQYLNQYFAHFSGREYSTVGAVIMNGNPFTKGHRYLIEQAKQQVEFLIIFVIEEDAYLFSFEERFRMIVDGTRDLNNIMVVPSGDFIFSKNNFMEYYRKHENEVVAYNAEYDINVFAEYIAEPLHITHRFAGVESRKTVIKIYNEAMKRILPSKGITYVEIPRRMLGNDSVDTFIVRKYLNDGEYEKAFALLPETTKQYLIRQI